MNYYRRYVGDYLRDTARLSMLEHGAYNLMLDYYYADEKPLPLDREELYTMVRAMQPEDRKAVDKVLSLYFTQREDGYHQGRVDEELRIAQTTIAKQRASGVESAAKRWGNESTDRSTHESTDRSTDGLTGGLQHAYEGWVGDTTTNHQPPTTQPPASKKLRASRLPSDWTLPEDWRSWAQAQRPNWPAPFMDRVADDFRDYWIAKGGRDACKVDWLATWRKWVRNTSDYKNLSIAPQAAKPWDGAS